MSMTLGGELEARREDMELALKGKLRDYDDQEMDITPEDAAEIALAVYDNAAYHARELNAYCRAYDRYLALKGVKIDMKEFMMIVGEEFAKAFAEDALEESEELDDTDTDVLNEEAGVDE